MLGTGGCQPSDGSEVPASSATVEEAAVRTLPLAAPLDDPQVEISGLAWYGDTLVVLPQYPHREATQGRRLWGIPRAEIDRYRADTTSGALRVFPIPVDASAVRSYSSAYEGCEALAFQGDTIYIVTESEGASTGMTGHLVRGRVAPGLEGITLEGPSVRTLPRQAALPNMSYEAMLLRGDTLVTLYEANGAAVNPRPRAYRFGPALQPVDSVRFPALEYRLTDATAPDEAGRFWVTNYFYPGERDLLQPATDSIARRHGRGATHARSAVVERLVEYQFANGRIRRTDRPPLWLRLGDGSGRNWEGVVRYGDGFLLATDRFPKTMLAYVDGRGR